MDNDSPGAADDAARPPLPPAGSASTAAQAVAGASAAAVAGTAVDYDHTEFTEERLSDSSESSSDEEGGQLVPAQRRPSSVINSSPAQTGPCCQLP
jgi:hypothetical protein